MGVISIFLGINLYVLFLGLSHKIFADKHGGVKALLLGNLIILATLLLGVMVYYW